MKLLFLSYSVDIGGLETYILRFGKWLSNNYPEHQIHVVCKSGFYGSYEEDFRAQGIKLYSISMGYFNLKPYFIFCRLLASKNYDVVCDFTGDFGGLTMFFSSISKVSKRIVFYRNARNSFVSNVFKRFYQYFINSLVLKYSTGILSNSEEALKHFFSDYPSVNDKRFKVIQNGVPLPLVLSVAGRNELRKNIGILPTRKIILHVGSSRWEKNHICMLKIAKLCQDNGSDICFCFAGSGIERDYNELAKKLNLRNILFLGERRDVGSLLQIADCFLFPSLSEGQPNALIEAVINSVPFVASNIATVKETLPLGWGNRWLFNPAKPEEGYLLLIEHMQNDFRNDSDFKDLVSWCKNTYNQDARFEELLATFKYDCFNNK